MTDLLLRSPEVEPTTSKMVPLPIGIQHQTCTHTRTQNDPIRCPILTTGEMDAQSLTQENIINLHKSKGCTKIHKSQNPTKDMFVLVR